MLAAVNLDSLGRMEGRELLLLGGSSATEWVHIARGIGFTTGIPSKLVADDLGSSDQRSFLEVGVPAVQIFGGAHVDYHRSSDTADKIDLAGLIQVASFVREAVVYLSERETPLTSTLGGNQSTLPAGEAGEARRVSLGTIPDFAYAGEGVRVESVIPESAAAQAGLQAGDILIRLGEDALTDLRSYADALARREPGQEVEIVILRDGQQLVLKATLRQR
jgi:membrane-associated protease RseP (regulator of RpoE activity)